jgi:TatD DNase family protein
VELFDTHIHLDSAVFDTDRADVLARARAAGVTRFVSIGAGAGPAAPTPESSKAPSGADMNPLRTPLASAPQALKLAESSPFIWASVGVHPHDARIESEESFERHQADLRQLAQHPRAVAIGETGLDFFYDFAPKTDQARWFKTQVALAQELHKPLIIHSRNAGPECLQLLIENDAHQIGGVFHCYSESAEFAAALRKINFMLSIPGIVTFKKSQNIREAVAGTPLDQIMLETDAPYLAPEPHRGKRCESSFMVKTAEMVAQIKGISLEEVARVTTANALRFFKIGNEPT